MDNEKELSGVLLIDKHKGVTSHDIVYDIRRRYQTKRVGHTGTLDPMATGVLVMLVGRAAKACEYLSHDRKRYRAVLKLGITTDTEDTTGKILTECKSIPDFETVKSVCSEFVGSIRQIPPMYSALKVNGQKLCDLARAGITVEREARDITVFSLECSATDKADEFLLDIHCSGGTYIRTLCSDIGARLGCGGAMAELTRTETGGYPLSDCITVEKLKSLTQDQADARLLPVESLFYDLPAVNLADFYEGLIRNGCAVSIKKLPISEDIDGKIRLCDKNGHFFALGATQITDGDKKIKAVKLFEL